MTPDPSETSARGLFVLSPRGHVRRAVSHAQWLQACSVHLRLPVGRDVIDGITVSTIFHGVDRTCMGRSRKRPMVFRTVLSGPGGVREVAQYSSVWAAIRGHSTIMDELRHTGGVSDATV